MIARIVTSLASLFVLGAGPATQPSTQPTTQPTTAPPTIVKGMTLDQANHLAAVKAHLDTKDGDGDEHYTLTLLDDSNPDDEALDEYTLIVRDGVIQQADVMVIHHPMLSGKAPPKLWPGNHWYAVTGLAPSGHELKRLVQARSLESAIKHGQNFKWKKVEAHLASESEQRELER